MRRAHNAYPNRRTLSSVLLSLFCVSADHPSCAPRLLERKLFPAIGRGREIIGQDQPVDARLQRYFSNVRIRRSTCKADIGLAPGLRRTRQRQVFAFVLPRIESLQVRPVSLQSISLKIKFFREKSELLSFRP